ncbi:MAG: 3-oxoacyl-ACP synthase III [Actinomycetes bacterium]|jgi:acyl-CoA:acyl-CoA alkyltransferase|nr:3-oxoacyl-ACP synthase III [Candidatus Nanopelagicales bacterium]
MTGTAPGNATSMFRDTAVLSVSIAEAPIVVTSAEFDEALASTYERLELRPGLLEGLAGIKERRWWPEDVSFADAAVMAGAKALADAGIDANQVGLLIDTSVCRTNLEPSAAVDVHHQLSLPTSALNFDLSNACLGFVNGMQLAGLMIDSGQIDYALIVDGEGSREPQQRTIERLSAPDATAQDVFDNFATLTLGSGGAAMVLGRASDHTSGHRFVGGAARAATQHHRLCVGDLTEMKTDSRALLEAGLQLAVDLWTEVAGTFDWNDLDLYVMHQVSNVHTAAVTAALGLDSDRTPLTFPMYGNIGPASIPFTLAKQRDELRAGDRVACLGIGSGLNAMVIEITW